MAVNALTMDSLTECYKLLSKWRSGNIVGRLDEDGGVEIESIKPCTSIMEGNMDEGDKPVNLTFETFCMLINMAVI